MQREWQPEIKETKVAKRRDDGGLKYGEMEAAMLAPTGRNQVKAAAGESAVLQRLWLVSLQPILGRLTIRDDVAVFDWSTRKEAVDRPTCKEDDSWSDDFAVLFGCPVGCTCMGCTDV